MTDQTDPSEDFRPTDVAWVFDKTALRDLLGAIETAVDVSYDLETTGLDEHDPRGAAIVLASLTLPQPDDADPRHPTTWEVPLCHHESPWLGRWRKVITLIAKKIVDERKPVTGANIKFDARWTYAHSGVDISNRTGWDVTLASRLLNENRTGALKAQAQRVFGVERWDDFDLSEFGAAQRVPIFDLGLYAGRDTYWTWRLKQHQTSLMFLDDDEGGPVDDEEYEAARLGVLAYWCAMPTAATLAAIEQRGVLLDETWCERERQLLLDEAEGIARALAARYSEVGLDPDLASFAPTSRWFQEWAAAAVKAGDLRVTALTATGKPQWSKAVLIRQARLEGAKGEVARELLRYRSAAKRAEFLTSWLGCQTPRGTVHANYNVGTVVTGRLSSSSPNMQQITGSLWPAWVPRPGNVGIKLDYSQIEMRVAAHISGDVAMVEAFRNGDDLHTMLAARITGKAEADVTKADRQKGKSANFGLLFGMGADGFQTYAETAYGVVMTADEAQAAHRAFFDTWPGIAAWHARTVERLHRTGQSVSPVGRIRRLPWVLGDWDDYRPHSAGRDPIGEAERMAINSPVQGFASDLMQMAAASVEGTLPGSIPVRGAALVGTVHDEIMVEAPADDWERVTRECMARMVDGVDAILRSRFHVTLAVPLAVEAKIGTRWGLDDVGTMSSSSSSSSSSS